MNQEIRQVLEMVAAGKVTVEEGERLLAAVENAPEAAAATRGRKPRFLRVEVREDENKSTVNIRVPLLLLRAGMRLASFVPTQVFTQVQTALQEEGIESNLDRLKPEEWMELVETLEELDVNVDSDGAQVRVYCE